MILRHLPNLDPSARRIVAFDFAPDMNLCAGEILLDAEVSVRLLSGHDDTPEALIDGIHQVESRRVLQRITGREDGNAYVIKVLANTSFGQRLALSASLRIREGS